MTERLTPKFYGIRRSKEKADDDNVTKRVAEIAPQMKNCATELRDYFEEILAVTLFADGTAIRTYTFDDIEPRRFGVLWPLLRSIYHDFDVHRDVHLTVTPTNGHDFGRYYDYSLEPDGKLKRNSW